MSQPTIPSAMDAAVQLQQAGRLTEAEQIYRNILTTAPHQVDALHNLGIIAAQTGRLKVGIEFIRRAITVQPGNAAFYNSLGNAMRTAGDADGAAVALRQAIQIRPDYPQAHNNIALAFRAKGAFDEAVSECRIAISLKPDYAQAHDNLGTCLRDIGRVEEAISAHRQAILLNPNRAEYYYNLGNSLRDHGCSDQAMDAYRKAINLNPNHAEAYTALGTALFHNGDAGASIGYHQRAIVANPDFVEGYINLALSLDEVGRMAEAVESYRRALLLAPTAKTYTLMGNALRKEGRVDDAIAAYQQSIKLDPAFAGGFNNLGNVLRDTGQIEQAITMYRKAMALDGSYAQASSNLVYCMQLHPEFDSIKLYVAHQEWNRHHAVPLKSQRLSHANDAKPERRLRVGFVSADFRNHVVARFLVPLFDNFDHRMIEVVCYSDVRVSDEVTERLRANADIWRGIAGRTDVQVAELVLVDRIDILIDLGMHTAGNRLLVFARKPAPVQVTWLAYPGTSGLDAIDYRLTDPFLDPPGSDTACYSEQSLRLCPTFWCYGVPAGAPDCNDLPALHNGYITFGCLNSFSKVSSATIDTWAALLRAVPNARLILHARPGIHRGRFLDRIAALRVDAARCAFVDTVSASDYFRQYHQIDIALDPFPWAGGTTSCDALWMGVPLVTLRGRTVVGRGGVSILSNIGLPELVADDTESYIRLASQLAVDLPRLTNLRSTLRQRIQSSPLMDGGRFAKCMESAFRDIWCAWCRTQT